MDVKNFTEENIIQIKNYIKSKTNVINESISWVDSNLKYEDKNLVLLKLKSAQNKLKKIASINLDSSRDVGMVYHETKTKYTFVKSDKKFYDIKLDVTELEDSKVVKTYKEIYTYKNGKYSLNK